ncbi:MAG: hypothetical protein IPH44_12020 [Myxococcales bacterium]|nr:hypothetical protein [Myxococcales bacterium]
MTARRALGVGAIVGVLVGLLAAAPAAHAQPADDSDGVIVVNGGASADELAKLRKRIEALGVLQPTSAAVSAALENEPPYDLQPIKDAYASFEFDRADELIEVALGELFANGAPDQMAAGAGELLYWRGLVADNADRGDDALAWFAAAFRIAPDLEIDRGTTSPRVRGLIDSARGSRPKPRTLYIDATAIEPGSAELMVDGGEPAPLAEQVDLAIGYHLVVVTARKKKPFAALVDIRAARDNGLEVVLDDEDDVSRARRLRLETLDARTTEDRLKRARRLAKLTGARRFLVIEGDTDPRVRVYDAVADTESAPMALKRATQPSVLAALLGVDAGALGTDPPPWYKRWYVWAAVGAVVAGGSVGLYAYSQREPTRITGF